MRLIHSPHAEAVLAQHVYQGPTNDCGPYCVAMVVNAVSAETVSGTAVAQETGRLGARGLLPVPRRVPGSATFPWGLVDILTGYGLSATWRYLASESDLTASLAAGRLPIVALGAWRPLWGHWVVVLAHSSELGWGLADPGKRSADMAWVSARQFSDWWRALGRVVVDVDVGRPATTGRRGRGR